MILITFLGKGNREGKYDCVSYEWHEQVYRTDLFPSVLPKLFPDLTAAKVFVTKESLAAHGDALRAQWPAEWQPDFITIPSGATPEQMWQIFDAIVAAVPANECVVFDITHGFRSLPLISILALGYLWSVRRVQLHALIYGAYEAKSGDVAPVFDLTPMVNLLEWLAAVERFRHHLDGSPLRSMLDGIQRRAHVEKSHRPPRKLQSAGKQLGQLTDALLLGRIREVLREAPRLTQSFTSPELAEEAGRWAKPLLLMLEPIKGLLDEIGNAPELDLNAHKRLVGLYGERRLYMQAITVFREWVISRACRLAGLPDEKLKDEKRRLEIEHQMGKHLQDKIERERGAAQPVPTAWQETPEGKELLQLWTRLPHIRNDVDHAGMKKEDKPASALIENIKSLIRGEPVPPITGGHSQMTVDLSTLYAATGTAKLGDLPAYEQTAKEMVPAGADVTLTGPAPVWLYLKIGHALHGRARRLYYDSPVTGSVLVFDHSPD